MADDPSYPLVGKRIGGDEVDRGNGPAIFQRFLLVDPVDPSRAGTVYEGTALADPLGTPEGHPAVRTLAGWVALDADVTGLTTTSYDAGDQVGEPVLFTGLPSGLYRLVALAVTDLDDVLDAATRIWLVDGPTGAAPDSDPFTLSEVGLAGARHVAADPTVTALSGVGTRLDYTAAGHVAVTAGLTALIENGAGLGGFDASDGRVTLHAVLTQEG